MTAARIWIAIAAALALSACGFYFGDQYANNAWLTKQAAQLQAAATQLQAEQARGDALTTGLLTQQAQIDQLKEDAHHAITTATTGRTCLDSAALRVLSHSPGITLVPAPTGSAAAADGPASTPADDSPAAYATDTQISTWAIDAAAQYSTCRARLDKLIDWYAAP